MEEEEPSLRKRYWKKIVVLSAGFILNLDFPATFHIILRRIMLYLTSAEISDWISSSGSS